MLKLKMQNTDAGKIRIILIGANAVINMQIQNQNRHIKTQKLIVKGFLKQKTRGTQDLVLNGLKRGFEKVLYKSSFSLSKGRQESQIVAKRSKYNLRKDRKAGGDWMQQKSELFHSKKIQRRRKLTTTKNNNIKIQNTED